MGVVGGMIMARSELAVIFACCYCTMSCSVLDAVTDPDLAVAVTLKVPVGPGVCVV